MIKISLKNITQSTLIIESRYISPQSQFFLTEIQLASPEAQHYLDKNMIVRMDTENPPTNEPTIENTITDNSIPSVLVAIPVKDSSKHLPDCLITLTSMDYPHNKLRFVFVYGESTDNTLDIIKGHFKKKTDLKYEIINDPPYKNPTGNSLYIADSMNTLSAQLKDEEFVLFLDSNIISIPPNTLKELIKIDRDIVAPIPKYKHGGRLLFYDYYGFRIGGKTTEHLQLNSDHEFFKNKEPIELDSVGTFVLVKAEVVKNIKWNNPFPWLRFNQDARKSGYKVYAAPYLTVIHADTPIQPLEYYVKEGVVPSSELDKIGGDFEKTPIISPQNTRIQTPKNKPEGLRIGGTCNTMNELELTKRHIKSWLDNTPWLDKLVIVDAPPPNGDTSTREWLREFVKTEGGPEKVLVELDKLWWIDYSTNRGIEQLLDCDYIATANNDNFFSPNWLEPLVKTMENDKSIGWMSPLTCDKDWNVISMGRNDFDELLYFPLDDSELLVPVTSTEGSVNVYRTKALEDIKNEGGWYDERVLRRVEMHMGMRFWEKGWKVMMSPKSAIIHLVSYSIKKHKTDRVAKDFAKVIEDCRDGWSKYAGPEYWNKIHPTRQVLKFKNKIRNMQKKVNCKTVMQSLYLPKNLQTKFVEPSNTPPIKQTKQTIPPEVGIFLPIGIFNPITKESIDSLIEQSFENWRCLIIVDSPNEEFLNYLLELREKEKRVDLLIHNYFVKDIVRLKNIGLNYWDNVPLLMYLTDDLIMEGNDCLGKMVRCLKENPEFGVVSPSFSGKSNPTFVGVFVCVGNLYTKECIDRVGIMDLQFSPHFSEEHDHMMQVIDKGFKPHRIANALMWHKKPKGNGTMIILHGKDFRKPYKANIAKLERKWGKKVTKIARLIRALPAIEVRETE